MRWFPVVALAVVCHVCGLPCGFSRKSNPFPLDTHVVTKGGIKYLRVTIKNNESHAYDCKLSELFYKSYESLDKFPVRFTLLAKGKFQHDFSFHPNAWTVQDPTSASSVEALYSGKSANGSFTCGAVNYPSLALAYSTRGPEKDMLFMSDNKAWPLPRAIEIRLISLKVKGVERLRAPLQFRVEPGGRYRIPSVMPREKPLIKYATRLVPNKRWSIQSIYLD
ncbi:MAG: hypothetical protein ABL949_04360 [Fimbriimonadaceae bacterium]